MVRFLFIVDVIPAQQYSGITSEEIVGGQVLFLVEILEAVVFNQQRSRLGSVYRGPSACAVRA